MAYSYWNPRNPSRMTHVGRPEPMPINPMDEDPFAYSNGGRSAMRISNDLRPPLPVPRPVEYPNEQQYRYESRPNEYPVRGQPEPRNDPYASSGPSASKYPRYDSRGQPPLPNERDFRPSSISRRPPSEIYNIPLPAPVEVRDYGNSNDSRRDPNSRYDSGRNEFQQQQPSQRSIEESYHARLEKLIAKRSSLQLSNTEIRQKSPPRPPTIRQDNRIGGITRQSSIENIENSRKNVMNDYFYKRSANPVASTAPRSEEWANKVDEFMGHVDKPRKRPQVGTPYDPEEETDIEIIEVRSGPRTPPPSRREYDNAESSRSKPRNAEKSVLDAINSVPSKSRWSAPNVERDKFGLYHVKPKSQRYSPEREDRMRIDAEIDRRNAEEERRVEDRQFSNGNDRYRDDDYGSRMPISHQRNIPSPSYERREREPLMERPRDTSRTRDIYDRNDYHYRESNRSSDRDRERRPNEYYDDRRNDFIDRRDEDSQEYRAANMVREVIKLSCQNAYVPISTKYI